MDALATLHALPLEYRDVLVLREVERRSYDEIGEALGLSRDLVASRLTGARRELLKRLDMLDNGPRKVALRLQVPNDEVLA